MFQTTKKNGFILPAAIFLMVGLSVILVAMFAIFRTSNITVKYDSLDSKAFLAAKTGIEYGFYQAKKNSNCSLTPATVNLSSANLTGFKFTYICEAQVANEAGNTLNFYKITSIGCNTTAASCPSTTVPDVENYVEKSLTSMIY